jgi:hypothetical protein
VPKAGIALATRKIIDRKLFPFDTINAVLGDADTNVTANGNTEPPRKRESNMKLNEPNT